MKYASELPYPCINDLDINIQYGQIILSNLGGLHSKMNTITLFLYNHIIIEDSWKELSDAFQKIAMIEMKHLQIFSKMCYLLGVDPRLWECHNDFLEYWSPGYNVYPKHIKSMLENAIIQKQNTISSYQYQIDSIDDSIIQEMLKRILLDEEIHVQILCSYLKQYTEKNAKMK